MEQPPLLNASVAAFVQSGLSITVAARDERLVPCIAKALACRVDESRREVRVLLFADAAEAVSKQLALNGQIAVCLSRPSTHETVQLKGRDARTALATAQDVAWARRSLDLFADDIGRLGWNRDFADILLWRDPADLIAICFTPEGAYAQTPGPGAGSAITP
jgi:hypothetical protein